jgi:hypothetical protein
MELKINILSVRTEVLILPDFPGNHLNQVTLRRKKLFWRRRFAYSVNIIDVDFLTGRII